MCISLSFFLFVYMLFYFGLCWVFVLHAAFSLAVVSGGSSLVAACRFPVVAASHFRAQALDV